MTETLTTGHPQEHWQLVLTAEEIAARQAVLDDPIPPGIGPAGSDDADDDAGVRSLLARGLLDGSGQVSDDLMLLFIAYSSATTRLSVLEHGPDGDVQHTFHFSDEVGVLHSGRPGGLHVFMLTEPRLDETELATLVLGEEPVPLGDEHVPPTLAELETDSTKYSEVSLLRRRGADVTVTDAVVAWTDRPWLVGSGDAGTIEPLDAALLATTLGID